MTARILATATLSLLFVLALGYPVKAATLAIYDQVAAPTVSIVPSDETQGGQEVHLINYTQQGALFMLEDGSASVYIHPFSKASLNLNRSGSFAYKVFHGAGPGLKSPTIPATLRGTLSVR